MKLVISTICAVIASAFLFISCLNGPQVAGKTFTAPQALLGADISYSFTDKTYSFTAMDLVLEEGTYRISGDSIFIKANGPDTKEEILNYKEDTLVDKEGLVLVNALTLKKDMAEKAVKGTISNRE